VLLAVPLTKLSSGEIGWQNRLGLFSSRFEEEVPSQIASPPITSHLLPPPPTPFHTSLGWQVPREVVEFENSTTYQEIQQPQPDPNRQPASKKEADELTARTEGSMCILCATNPRTHMVAPVRAHARAQQRAAAAEATAWPRALLSAGGLRRTPTPPTPLSLARCS
jgi:hypothetical protein